MQEVVIPSQIGHKENNMQELDLELEMQTVRDIKIPYAKVAELEPPLTLQNEEGEDVVFDEDSLSEFKQEALQAIEQDVINKIANDAMLIKVAKKQELK